jgi:transcriptional regulator with XRE-family HTH domain
VVRTAATDLETIGQRLARLRKEKGLTQVELAERLKINQSMMSDYERDVIRLHGELIVQLTQILGVSADELLGLKSEAKKNGSIKNRRLLRQVQALDKLSKRDQQALLRTIEAFLSKAG